MKIRFALFLFSVFCTFSASAQWTWRNPLPQGNDLDVIRVLSDNSVWAAGYTGTIMHSTDGGLNWQIQNVFRSTKNVGFIGLDFPSDSIGFAVDRMGCIFKSHDGGATWDSIYWDGDEYLLAASFQDELNGVVTCAGGLILRTTDGGSTWEPWALGDPVSFSSVAFPSPLVGYVAGDEYILKTTDGGHSWNIVYDNPAADLRTVAFSSTNVGFAAGLYGLVKTIDGGTSWTSLHINDTAWFNSIGIYSPDTLVLNGMEWNTYVYGIFTPVRYRSTDGGTTWIRLQLPADSWNIYCITAQSGGTAYLAGSSGSLIKTTDYGDTWTELSDNKTPPNHDYSGCYGIDFPTAQTGYAVMDRNILKTTDGGETWVALDTVFPDESLFAVGFADENMGCIGGNSLYTTFDGGETWVCRISISGSFRSIAFAGATTCVAVGGWGIFYRSVDSGLTWTVVNGVPQDFNWTAVCFADDSTGYATGFSYGGPPPCILKTIDAGATWTITGTGFYLFGLSFTSPETGFGVGLNGLIIATTDGGISWTELGTPREEDLWNVSFYDADTGYAVGGYDGMRSIILKTTDGGTTWHEQFIPSNYPLYAVATTGNSAFTGGLYCNLFGTTNGGIGVSSGPPADLRGHFISVFPNPASSVITIETQCPGQLSILSLPGQILLTYQVEEPKSSFDISSLPRGVYLVRFVGDKGMQVGKFIKE